MRTNEGSVGRSVGSSNVYTATHLLTGGASGRAHATDEKELSYFEPSSSERFRTYIALLRVRARTRVAIKRRKPVEILRKY